MMKPIFVPHLEEITEWKQCYYDFQTLFQLRLLMQQSANVLSALRAYAIEINRQRGVSGIQLDKTHELITTLQNIMYPCNEHFYKYSHHEIAVTYMFAQYKSFQIIGKFFKYKAFASVIKKGDYDLTVLLENLYIEAYYLKRMISFNISKQKIAMIEFQQLTKTHTQLAVNISNNRKMNRMKMLVKNIKNKIKQIYILKSTKDSNAATNELKQYNDSSLDSTVYVKFFGLWTGVLVAALACIIFFVQYQNISVKTDKIFQNVFPIWRGASYVILYFWILGFLTLSWQVLKIDYKLILQMDSNYMPRSSFLLLAASIFTGIYMILFTIFIIDRAYHFSVIRQQHLAGMAWLSFLIFVFFPLPVWHHKGRLYFLFLLLQALLSPFTRMTFLKIYITQQIVSFNQPASDFVYTVCKYVTNFDSKTCNDTAPLVSMIILAIMFLYRMIQNFKMGWQLNSPLFSQPYMGLLRAFLSLITVIAAYMYRKFPNDGTLSFWIVFASVATVWAWFVDIKFDWGLFANLPNERILRPKLIFPRCKPFYYIMIVLNLLMRAAWVLTISPAIVKASGILPLFFIMILSFVEIIRRGIWDFFIIQFRHMINCENFQAIVDYSSIEQSVAQRYQQITLRKVEQDIQQSDLKAVRTKSQLELVIQSIRIREQHQIKIKQFLTQSKAQMQTIKKNLPNHIKNRYL